EYARTVICHARVQAKSAPRSAPPTTRRRRLLVPVTPLFDFFAQRREADGLGQMTIEAGFVRLLPVLRPAEAGQRDEPDTVQRPVAPCAARDVVAVHARQIDVDDGGIGGTGLELRE